jgi:hypothetical protein
VEAARQALEAAQRRWFGEPGHRDGFILRGPLLSDDGAGWVGSALLVQLKRFAQYPDVRPDRLQGSRGRGNARTSLGDRAAVAAMLAGAPYVQAGLYASVEIHDWQFGGRHQG